MTETKPSSSELRTTFDLASLLILVFVVSLAISGALYVFYDGWLANQLLNYTFWFAVGGVLLRFVEMAFGVRIPGVRFARIKFVRKPPRIKPAEVKSRMEGKIRSVESPVGFKFVKTNREKHKGSSSK